MSAENPSGAGVVSPPAPNISVIKQDDEESVILYQGPDADVEYHVRFDPQRNAVVVEARAPGQDTVYGVARASRMNLVALLKKDLVKQFIPRGDRKVFLSAVAAEAKRLAEASRSVAESDGDREKLLLYLYKQFYEAAEHPLLVVQRALSSRVCGMYRERLLIFLSLFTIHSVNKVYRPVAEFDVEEMKGESYFPPNVLVLGDSGSGKTHMIDAVWRFFPRFDLELARGVLVLDDVKPSFLRYLAGAGEDRGFEVELMVDGMTIIIRDWEKLRKSNPELRLIVEETGQLKVATTVKNSRNEFRPKIYVLRGSINLVVASTERAVEEQTADRSIVVTVTLVDKEVLKEYYKTLSALRRERPDIYAVLRADAGDTSLFIRLFPEIYSTYAPKLGLDPNYADVYITWVFDVFPAQLAKPRFMKQVITLSRALAIMNFPHRTILVDAWGNRLIAVHPEDVMLVLDMLHDILVEKTKGVNKRLARVLEALKAAEQDKMAAPEELDGIPGYAASAEEVARKYRELYGELIHPKRVREAMATLSIYGYVDVYEGKRRKKYYVHRADISAASTRVIEDVARRVREVAARWPEYIDEVALEHGLAVVELKPSRYVSPFPGDSMFEPEKKFSEPLALVNKALERVAENG